MGRNHYTAVLARHDTRSARKLQQRDTMPAAGRILFVQAED
jgi:hypothetical protein